jgi:DNA excision repair protein ERCC-3
MSLGPLIVQSDRTVLLETDHPQAKDARHELAIFAELERAPEHIRSRCGVHHRLAKALEQIPGA